MKQRALLLCLVLMLIVGGVAAWILLTRTEPAPANQFPVARAPADARPQRVPDRPPEREPQFDRPATPDVAGKTPVEPEIAGTPPEAPADVPADGWLVRGRVVSLKVDGVEVLGRMPISDLPLGICYRVFGGDDHSVFWLDPKLSGNGAFTDVIGFDQLPKDQGPAAWFFAGGTVGGDTPLDEEQLNPGAAANRGLVKPTIRGQVMDLGNLSLEVGASLQETFLVVGRLLGPQDTPLATTQSFEFGADLQQEHFLSIFARPNGQGRFAAQLEHNFDDPESDPLSAMQWWIKLDGDRNFIWGLRMTDEFAESLGRMQLGAPTRQGRVLDFGDIRIAGSLVEVLMEFEGQKPPVQAEDHFLVEDFEYSCWVNLHAGDNSFSTGLVAGLLVRLIVPEGRYQWRVKNNDPEVFWPPLEGDIAARQGEVVRIHAVLRPAPMIPVTVLDPSGAELQDAQVYWQIEYQPDTWLSGDALKGNLVPMLPGNTTVVSASHTRFEGADAEATPGTTSVTLKFTTVTAGVGHISVKLPLLPKEFGLPSIKARLMIEDRDIDDVDLTTDSRPMVDAQSWEPGTYRLQLRIGGYFGYPDGVLSEITGIELKEGDNLELEFPPIAPPPWAVPAGSCIAILNVGGHAADLCGTWLYGNKPGRGWIVYNSTILSATEVVDGDVGRGLIPRALKAGNTEYATQITMPAEAWGMATVALDMPVRLTVRLKRRGTPIDEFTAHLLCDNAGSRVTVRGGVARLWCPAGKAQLQIEVGSQTLPNREVQVTDAETELEINLDDVRVEFQRHEADNANWTVAPATAPALFNRVDTQRPMMLQPQKYLIRPAREHDQSAAFELDLTNGQDRVIELPWLEPFTRVDIHIAMSEADWKGFHSGSFWYWQPVKSYDDPLSGEFEYSQEDLASRAMPDALVLRGVPRGRTILLRGVIYRRAEGGAMEIWFLQPCQFLAAEDHRITPVWRKGVTLHGEWSDLEIRSVSMFEGYWVTPHLDYDIPPGRHEIVVLKPDGTEALRTRLDVPPDATEFRIPPDLRRQLEAAELLEPESEDDE